MNNEAWLAFIKTPLGKAFFDFDQAHAHALVLDTRSGSENDYIPEKRLKDAWAKERSARSALMALLYDLAGVGPYEE